MECKARLLWCACVMCGVCGVCVLYIALHLRVVRGTRLESENKIADVGANPRNGKVAAQGRSGGPLGKQATNTATIQPNKPNRSAQYTTQYTRHRGGPFLCFFFFLLSFRVMVG
jgi:hypothetical protein